MTDFYFADRLQRLHHMGVLGEAHKLDAEAGGVAGAGDQSAPRAKPIIVGGIGARFAAHAVLAEQGMDMGAARA